MSFIEWTDGPCHGDRELEADEMHLAHIEQEWDQAYEDYEPNPYDGTYSEE